MRFSSHLHLQETALKILRTFLAQATPICQHPAVHTVIQNVLAAGL